MNINLAVMSFVLGTLILLIVMVVLAKMLGSNAKGHKKNTPFESGIVATGSSKIRFSAKFYLVAMLFVIFDIEALYLFCWSVSVRKVGWQGLIGAALFIVILLIGLSSDVKKGVLDWAPGRRR